MQEWWWVWSTHSACTHTGRKASGGMCQKKECSAVAPPRMRSAKVARGTRLPQLSSRAKKWTTTRTPSVAFLVAGFPVPVLHSMSPSYPPMTSTVEESSHREMFTLQCKLVDPYDVQNVRPEQRAQPCDETLFSRCVCVYVPARASTGAV